MVRDIHYYILVCSLDRSHLACYQYQDCIHKVILAAYVSASTLWCTSLITTQVIAAETSYTGMYSTRSEVTVISLQKAAPGQVSNGSQGQPNLCNLNNENMHHIGR
ncbi:hypothetical protein P692DRAFT_20141310 [Suillus brevipes Sb2]|nr:hypothetical protein P692DRAFT_20141310 [Suillus brevipes Sb2]